VSKRTKFLLSIGVIAALVVGWQMVAFATLSGSNFEIDPDANLKLDGAPPLIDWGLLPRSARPTPPAGRPTSRSAREPRKTPRCRPWSTVASRRTRAT
jgi:hypothetical protein